MQKNFDIMNVICIKQSMYLLRFKLRLLNDLKHEKINIMEIIPDYVTDSQL